MQQKRKQVLIDGIFICFPKQISCSAELSIKTVSLSLFFIEVCKGYKAHPAAPCKKISLQMNRTICKQLHCSTGLWNINTTFLGTLPFGTCVGQTPKDFPVICFLLCFSHVFRLFAGSVLEEEYLTGIFISLPSSAQDWYLPSASGRYCSQAVMGCDMNIFFNAPNLEVEEACWFWLLFLASPDTGLWQM